MSLRPSLHLAVLLVSLLVSQAAFADGIDEGDKFFSAGQYDIAADKYYAAYIANRTGGRAAEALVKTGRALDLAKKNLYEKADGRCYLGKKSERQARPECFEADVADLNRRYGEGAFSYHGDQVQYSYNATHFRKILDEFSNSSYQEEASLMMLRGKELLSDEADSVIQKVDDWLAKYPSSKLRPKGLLLLGRLHADAFVTFKSGGFILINGKVDPEGIAMRRSKYQAKGLAAFQEVFEKYGSSTEASTARREYDLLKAGQDDGIFYGVSY